MVHVQCVLAGAWLEVFHTLGGDSTVLPLTEGHQSLHTLISVCVCVCAGEREREEGEGRREGIYDCTL